MAKSQLALVKAVDIEADLTHLLQQMLELVGEDTTSSTEASDRGKTEETVLEFQLNGASYALIRSIPEPQNDQAETSLSPREQEVARLVTKGLPNKAIAAVLEISPWTVATHLRRVYSKLGINSRAEMVARVLQDNLIENYT